MRAVWLVRSRQLMSRMRFWIAITGYDAADRSFTNRAYLLYLVIFFCFWGCAVLALFADQLAFIFSAFGIQHPVPGAVAVVSVILLVVALFQSYRYARRSPFVFSEDDAVLICLTPVDRRLVALAWLLGEWIPAGVPYWSLAIILSFSFLQLTLDPRLFAISFPFFVLAAVRAVSIMLPLHLTLMAGTYLFGAMRLRGAKDLPYLGLVPLIIAIVLSLIYMYNPATFLAILWPLSYPLKSGFGEAQWMSGFIVVILWLCLNLALLYLLTPGLNLSRAAQESLRRRGSKLFSSLGE